MTISTNKFMCVVAAGALGLLAVPTTVLAADGVSEDDVDVDVDEEDDDDAEDCDEADDDCENEAHASGGCSGTIATDLGQNIGGMLCALGLVGWQLRRRRAA